jgi:hypothetical protein
MKFSFRAWRHSPGLPEAFLSLSRSGYAASRSFDGVNRTSNSNEPTSEFGPEADIGALT